MTRKTRSGSASAANLPYQYKDDAINFDVTGFSVDGGEPGDANRDDREVSLFEYDSWDEATILVTVSIDEHHLNRILEGGPPYKAKLIVVVDSQATQMRFESIVKGSELKAGTYESELSLNRQLFRGTLSLTPRIVRTEDSNVGLPYAPRKGMRVAGGEQWKVLINKPEQSGSGFPFLYRDFSEGDYPADAVHLLRSDPSEPAVLINNQNDEIVDVLQTETFYSADAYLKNVLKAELGVATWFQLVIHTVTTIAESGEPEFRWQEGVVEEMRPFLYDDDATYDEAVDRLGEVMNEPRDLREFVRELNVALQRYLDQAERLNKYINEFHD